MKKILVIALIAPIVLGSCRKKGCTDSAAFNYDSEAKKADVCTYLPTITLTGPESDTIDVGSAYIDQGATATNIDGSSVDVTVDASLVDTANLGSYIVTYSATNEIGTVTTEREVVVKIGPASWLGAWTTTHVCSAVQFPVTADPTVTVASTLDSIRIENMFNLVGGTISCYIDGQDISVPEQTINITLGDIILSGSGSMNGSATQFSILYDYENTIPLVGDIGSCEVFYDK